MEEPKSGLRANPHPTNFELTVGTEVQLMGEEVGLFWVRLTEISDSNPPWWRYTGEILDMAAWFHHWGCKLVFGADKIFGVRPPTCTSWRDRSGNRKDLSPKGSPPADR